jgi:hypothetical protein
MYVSIILALLLSQIPDAPVAKKGSPPDSQADPTGSAFELQGDKLGESPEAFAAQHPKAECDTSQKAHTSCYQWADVSIFELSAHAAAGCNLKKRYAADCLQGLTARFADQRLVSLVYTVAGSDKSQATTALKKQLGSPTMDSRDGSVWNKNGATISVVVGKAMEEPTAPSLLTISIAVAN